MEFIKSWSLVIAGTVMFGAMCEILIPGGEMKKYVRIVLGLILVLSIIKPLTGLSEKDFYIHTIETKKAEAYQLNNKLEEKQKTDVLRIYKMKLSEKIVSALNEKLPSYSIEIKPEILTENKDKFGEIISVLALVDSGEPDDGVAQAIKRVLKDKFGVDEDKVSVKYIKS